jgi:hypothetical protein
MCSMGNTHLPGAVLAVVVVVAVVYFPNANAVGEHVVARAVYFRIVGLQVTKKLTGLFQALQVEQQMRLERGFALHDWFAVVDSKYAS